jgi:hypothetical protein
MSEETTVLEPQTGTESGAVDTAGNINQQGYIDDAFEDYFRSPAERDAHREQEHKPPTAQKPQNTKAQPAQPQKPQAPKAETPKAPEPANETKPTEKQEPNPIDAAFQTDSGAFDETGFLNWTPPDFAAIPEAARQQESAAGNAQPALSPVQQAVEQDRVNAKQTRDAVDQIYGDIIQNLQAQGLDTSAVQAKLAAQHAQIDAWEREQMRAREREMLDSIEKRVETREQAAQMAARAQANTNEIISTLPGKTTADKTAVFNSIMFTGDAAEALNRAFRTANPDIDKITEDERKQRASEFLNRVSANKSDLAHYFKIGWNSMRAARLPQLINEAVQTKLNQEKANALSAQKAPQGTTQRSKPTPSAWDVYLNGSSGADRV